MDLKDHYFFVNSKRGWNNVAVASQCNSKLLELPVVNT